MKAVGTHQPLPITADHSLVDVELPEPKATGRDLLVRVHAVSVNPVDVKIRASFKSEDGSPRVLGWDASGVVEAVGPDVTLFRPGDEVFLSAPVGALHVFDREGRRMEVAGA